MRRIISILLIFTALTGYARQISLEEAESVATEFFNSGSNPKLKSVSHDAVKVMSAKSYLSEHQPFYVFNAANKGGFVLISGDDRAKKILGYSDKGTFDLDNMPPQLSALLDQYAKQIAEIPKDAPQDASWSAPRTRSEEGGVLLETANWGQGYPYNAQCPIIDSVQAPTGCVATAMAIVMKYHNWPEQGNGKHINFFDNNLSWDYESYKPDWKAIGNIEDNNLKLDEIAKLHLSAGIAIDTHYDKDESYADISFLGNVLSSRFNFAPTTTFYKDHYSDEEWLLTIKKELDESRIVLYSGYGSTGHEFVVDGYDDNNLYHINWGWEGEMNGYFNLLALNVGSMDLSQDHVMITGIEPNRTEVRYSSFMVNDGVARLYEIKNEGLNFTVNHIKSNERFGAVLPYLYGDVDNTGSIGLAVVDDEYNIIELVGIYRGDEFPSDKYLNREETSHYMGYGCEQIWMFECGDYKLNKYLYGYHLHDLKIDTEIKPGYKLQVIARDNSTSKWEIVLGSQYIATAVELENDVRSEWCPVSFEYDHSILEISGTDDYSKDLTSVLKDGIVRFRVIDGGAGTVSAEGSSNMTFYNQESQIGSDPYETNYCYIIFYAKNQNFCKLTIDKTNNDYSKIELNDKEIEIDGIVYSIGDKKVGEIEADSYACVIGYTGKCSENVKIENSVKINRKE